MRTLGDTGLDRCSTCDTAWIARDLTACTRCRLSQRRTSDPVPSPHRSRLGSEALASTLPIEQPTNLAAVGCGSSANDPSASVLGDGRRVTAPRGGGGNTARPRSGPRWGASRDVYGFPSSVGSPARGHTTEDAHE